MSKLKAKLKQSLPATLRRRLTRLLARVRAGMRQLRRRLLPVRKVGSFARLRRLTPVSRRFGWERGLPIDRYYIEQFLAAHAADIAGRVLEIQSDVYTRRFGGARVTRCDVLDIAPDNPQATLIADLTDAAQLPAEQFDCILCTQTLLLIYDVRAALQTLYRLLKPGGVLLATAPGVAHKIVRYAGQPESDCWRFTSYSLRRLLGEVFPAANVEVKTYGNVLAATAFLHGLASEELTRAELDYHDPDYEVSLAARAVKPAAGLLREDAAG